MALHPPARVTGRGPAPDWGVDAGESIPPPPVAAPAEQLSLFVFEDAAGPRLPRLRRLRSLISALDSQRQRLAALESLDARRTKAAQGTTPPLPPPPLWPDSFFD